MAAINQAIELDFPADKITGRTTALVNGGRLLKYSGSVTTDGHRRVAHAGAGEVAQYLARHDAASGADVSMVNEGLWTATAGAAITAPAAVKCAAGGKVIPATTGDVVVGYVLTDAAADLDIVYLQLALPGHLESHA